MATLSTTSTVREILTAAPTLTADEVIKKAHARGLNASAETIRSSVHNIRSELKKKGVTVAAQSTAVPVPPPATQSAAVSLPAGDTDLARVLANITLVDRVIGACGGHENVLQAAEAVKACGGVEAFVQHLATVAAIRRGTPA